VGNLEKRLAALPPGVLASLVRGIEKEGLRACPDATLAQTPHPAALGSALTHDFITTDFSESQLELITGVHPNADACVAQITEIHQFVCRHLGDEVMWGTSMPCRLPVSDDGIPLGRYGESNVGLAKTVYRMGLSYRYGRRMQTISGIHYNFSLPDDAWAPLREADGWLGPDWAHRNDAYFALIRNFRRHSWLLLYLFGASPALERSFVSGREHGLQPLGDETLHLPYATSLRMGPLGYQSDAQASLAVSYNGLAGYARSLHRALSEPFPRYQSIGIRDGGHYRQLADTLLQIENEFYGTIRPKRRIRPGERPLRALGERGVEYVEVRCMDIDPFLPVGIDARTMRTLDVFLLHCLLQDSPPDTPDEIANNSRNQHLAAQRGRDPSMRLTSLGRERSLPQWGRALLSECADIAAALDDANGGRDYRDALDAARAALEDAASTPSARVLERIRARHADSFIDFALERSLAHRAWLRELRLPAAAAERYEAMARDSIARQRAIEAADRVDFETYRREYLGQELMAGEQLRV